MKLWLACVLMMLGGGAFAQEPFVVLTYNSDSQAVEQSGEAHTIRQGETLNRILRQYFGASANLAALARETVQLNPHAFRGGDANRMLGGQTLRLPDGQVGLGAIDDIYFF